MGKQIVKQPNGLYAIWSSVVDNFVGIDYTIKDIVDEWTEAYREELKQKLCDIAEQLGGGGKPYHQFTKTWDECIALIREIHGDDTESLRMIEELNEH